MEIPPPRAPLPQRGQPTPLAELVGDVERAPPRPELAALEESAHEDSANGASPSPCEPFARWIREDAAGALDREQLSELRAHLTQCAPCLESRRQAIATLAQVGRGLRAGRAGAPPKTPVRAQGLLARRRTLLLFLTACAGLFLASRSGILEGADPRLWATAEGRAASAGGEPMEVGGAPRLLVRGDVLVVEEGGELRLDSGRLKARLAAGRMLVESSIGPRLRLVEGELELEGRGRVVTPDGVLDLESGALALVAEEKGTRLRVSNARGSWTGVRGARRLEPGLELLARWDEPVSPTRP